MGTLSSEQATALLRDFPGWTLDGNAIRRQFVFRGFPDAVDFVTRLVPHAEAADHHPDVLINYNVLGLPMGGWKNSGIGVRHGAQGIRRFCHTEAVTIPRMPTAKSEPVWFPYSARKRGVVRRIYRFLNARGLRNRLRG